MLKQCLEFMSAFIAVPKQTDMCQSVVCFAKKAMMRARKYQHLTTGQLQRTKN